MIYNNEIAAKVASMLLQVNAIKLQAQNPFTWSSGWKSPIYCDNRISLSSPEVRSYVKQQLKTLIAEKFPQATAIAGVATAGIAQGALVADLLELPYAYVRPEPKKHGLGNQIEGKLYPTDKVVMVEDLISTGGSSIKAANAVAELGAEVLGVVAIFDYQFQTAIDNFADAGYPFYTLSGYKELLPQAKADGVIQEADIEVLEDWSKDPANWSVPA